MPKGSALLSPSDLDHMRGVVSRGFENAARGLSIMVEKDIRVVSPSLKVVPIERVPEVIGKPEEEVLAMYLGVSGDTGGHILLILSLRAAEELVVMLMGPRESGSPLGDVELSALGEVANVTGSVFLNALASATGLSLLPSPPGIVIDMAGAVLDGPLLAMAMSMEEALIIDTRFEDDDRHIGGLFLMLPDAESLRLILERLDLPNG